MKRLITMAVMMTIVFSASAMSFSSARAEALYLSDKMAYELDLTAAQYDAVYEINLDYMMSIAHRGDIFGLAWERRNADLRYVLDGRQYALYIGLNYFYRPVYWHSGAFAFRIYSRYADRARFFFDRPTVFVSYKGGRNHFEGSFYAGRHFDNGPRMSTNGRTKGNVTVNKVNVNVVNNGNNRAMGTMNHGTISNRDRMQNTQRSVAVGSAQRTAKASGSGFGIARENKTNNGIQSMGTRGTDKMVAKANTSSRSTAAGRFGGRR